MGRYTKLFHREIAQDRGNTFSVKISNIHKYKDAGIGEPSVDSRKDAVKSGKYRRLLQGRAEGEKTDTSLRHTTSTIYSQAGASTDPEDVRLTLEFAGSADANVGGEEGKQDSTQGSASPDAPTSEKDANDPADFEALNSVERRVLLDWIEKTFMPGSIRSASSYALKHYFEAADDGFYITNGQFKGAMLEAGFEPLPNQTDRSDWINWHFKLDKRVPDGPRRP
jgi:hypothetical protein